MPKWKIFNADIVEWANAETLRVERGDSERYHAVFCDPPYGITFMGKDWDRPRPAGMNDEIVDESYVFHHDFQEWSRQWVVALIPILHSGALVFAFGGTRMWHRMACGFEDAGFQIWDTLMWLHGQGFPKAVGIDLMMDKHTKSERRVTERKYPNVQVDSRQVIVHSLSRGGSVTESVHHKAWAGHKTAQLKPAYEPVVVFRAPYDILAPKDLHRLEELCAEGSLGKTDTRSSGQGSGSGSLSIGLSHSECLNVLYERASMSTTKMGKEATIDLAILKSLISETTRDSTIRGKFRAHGFPSLAVAATKFLKSAALNSGKQEVISALASVLGPRSQTVKLINDYAAVGGLSPDWEPVLCFKAPAQGESFAEMASEYGAGALNVDGGRIEGTVTTNPLLRNAAGFQSDGLANQGATGRGVTSVGRYPANLALDEDAAAMLDAQVGDLGRSIGGRAGHEGDSGGPSRFFYCAKASRSEREAGLGEFDKRAKGYGGKELGMNASPQRPDGSVRHAVSAANDHPTVKPIDLCRWLATLLLPPASVGERRLLVPFSGSGSEVIGSLKAGWDSVTGVEREAHYCDISKARIRHAFPKKKKP